MSLTAEQLEAAAARARARVEANRPGDEWAARHWLRIFEARLAKAVESGRRA